MPELLRDEVIRWTREIANFGPEPRNCPLCHSDYVTYLFTKWDFYHIECSRCGLIFISPEPSPAVQSRLYSEFDYYKKWLELVERPALERGISVDYMPGGENARHAAVLSEVSRWKQRGIWLDYGGGTGRLVKYVDSGCQPFSVYLYEPDPVASDLASLYCTSCGSLSDSELGEMEGTFDVITLIAAIEHIPDTRALMHRLYSLLAPGGIIYMTMPRLGYLTRHISKDIPYDVIPPMHLRFFSEKTLWYLSGLLDREDELNGGLVLRKVWQSGERRFHIGHLFKPDWYTMDCIVSEHELDMRKRVLRSGPTSLAGHLAHGTLEVVDRVLGPLTTALDGRRLLHAVWQRRQ